MTAQPSLRELLEAALDDPSVQSVFNGVTEMVDAILATPSGKALASHFEREALVAVFDAALAYVMDDTTTRAEAEERLFAVMEPHARAALQGGER